MNIQQQPDLTWINPVRIWKWGMMTLNVLSTFERSFSVTFVRPVAVRPLDSCSSIFSASFAHINAAFFNWKHQQLANEELKQWCRSEPQNQCPPWLRGTVNYINVLPTISHHKMHTWGYLLYIWIIIHSINTLSKFTGKKSFKMPENFTLLNRRFK